MRDDDQVVGELSIRRLSSGDDHLVIEAAELFDEPPRPSWVQAFLGEPTHHLLIAYRHTRAAGFVTAVEMVHPDKGREMFVYELGVAPDERRQGIATELLAELVSVAKLRHCYDMWVLTDGDNVAAIAAYTSSGARRDGEHLMLTWDWSGPGDSDPRTG